MSDFINSIDIFGDDVVTDSIIERSITEYDDNCVTTIGLGAFKDCAALNRVNLPAATVVKHTSFEGCAELTRADFAAATNIEDYAFKTCQKFVALILRNKTQVVNLNSQKVFTSTPIKSGGTGYIYVPRTMADGSDGVEAYKAATNWSAFSSQIRAIEDYPDICGG